MEQEDYHFKFRIIVVGDKHVGKSAFMDSIANSFGKIVENENSDELNIRVLFPLPRQSATSMTTLSTRFNTGNCQATTEV